MPALRRAAIKVGGTCRVGTWLACAFRDGATQRIEGLGVASGRSLFQPGARLDEIAGNALAAEKKDPEIELGPHVAGRGGLLEQLGRPVVVARHAGEALRVGQGQPVRAFARTGIGGMLYVAQAIAIRATIDQHRAEPCFGIGVAWGQRAQSRFGSSQVAGAIGRHGGTQGWRDVGAGILLSARTPLAASSAATAPPGGRSFGLEAVGLGGGLGLLDLVGLQITEQRFDRLWRDLRMPVLGDRHPFVGIERALRHALALRIGAGHRQHRRHIAALGCIEQQGVALLTSYSFDSGLP